MSQFGTKSNKLRPSIAIGFALLLMAAAQLCWPVNSNASEDDSDVQDILFCGLKRPYLLRLHLRVKGDGFRQSLRAWADSQFQRFDANSDGALDGEEWKRMPASAVSVGQVAASADSLPADDDPKDGRVSAAEFRRYLLAATGTPFRLITQASGGVVITNDAANAQVNLFPKLDTDHDGKLSSREIDAAAARLRRYDRNEDDAVDAVELQQSLPEEQAAAQQRLSGVMGLLVIVDSEPAGQSLSRRLLEGYDKVSRDPATKTFRKDQLLSPAELPIDAGEFRRADRNGDGKLDRMELLRLPAAMTPSVELAVEAPAADGKFSIDVLRTAENERASPVHLKPQPDGRPVLTLNDTSLSLSASAAEPGIEQELRDLYVQQFKSLDRDKNDYLDRPELQRFGFSETFFTQADLDRDEKLFEAEYKSQIDRELELSQTSFSLEVSGDGRSLFRLIDTQPADGRLSLRELADASAKLKEWDANRDGTITQQELSITLNAVFQTGMPRINGPFVLNRRVSADSIRNAASAAGADIPPWFVKMDRNGDGDLSPNEFLGRRALFQQIDQNEDGLISSSEALAAHRKAIAKTPP